MENFLNSSGTLGEDGGSANGALLLNLDQGIMDDDEHIYRSLVQTPSSHFTPDDNNELFTSSSKK
jgi:hypothetical protein